MKRIATICILLIAWSLLLTAQTTDYQLYPVKQSEGWYRVSKKFGLSQEELRAANPQCGDALRLGDTLRIPTKNKLAETETALPPIDTAQYVIHTLQPKETLYGLSRRYGVSMEDIIRWNGDKATRMAIGTQLRIQKATTQATVKPTVQTTENITVDTQVSNTPSVKPENTQEKAAYVLPTLDIQQDMPALQPSELPIRMAFLLPFMLDMTGQDAARSRFVEFYEGALLAIKDAKAQGVNIELHTFDVEKSDIKVQLLLQQPQLKLMDAIIGPAYPAQVEYISNFAFDNKINTFIPFTSEVPALQINPYLFQFNVPSNYEAECLTNVLMQEHPTANYILINNGGNASSLGKKVAKELEAHAVKVKQVSIAVDEADTLRHYLREDIMNVLIFSDNRYAYAKPYLQKLDNWRSMPTEVVGGYTWQTHEAEIGVPYYYSSLFLPSAGTARRESYLANYSHYFMHQVSSHHPRYDMLGYDLTSLIISAINQYGAGGLQEKIVELQYRGIQSDISFVRPNPMGGYVNLLLNIQRYDNGATHTLKSFKGNLNSETQDMPQ